MGKMNHPESRDEIVAMVAALGIQLSDVELEMLLPVAQATASAMCEVDELNLGDVPPADVYVPGGE